jgi:hypothetical protein
MSNFLKIGYALHRSRQTTRRQQRPGAPITGANFSPCFIYQVALSIVRQQERQPAIACDDKLTRAHLHPRHLRGGKRSSKKCLGADLQLIVGCELGRAHADRAFMRPIDSLLGVPF